MLETTEILHNERTVLVNTDAFEIVSIRWKPGVTTTSHHHGLSQCMVLIEEGRFENILNLGFKTESQVLTSGEVVITPIGAAHEMRCLSAHGKTLHIYSPKISATETAENFNTSINNEVMQKLQLQEPTEYESLRRLMQTIREQSITTSSPYFMNQLFSGVLPQTILAEELISQTKTTMATFEASPIFSTIESEVIDSLCAQIGWSESHRDGVCVPGGSAANFMAVHCARQKKFPDVKEKGMRDLRLQIFASAEAHYSLKKACVALGLGSDSLIEVPVDNRGRMSPTDLKKIITESMAQGFLPLMVCATAGTTVLGAFDPLEELAAICKHFGIWLHVDAAWGGPALFSDQLRPLIKGIVAADSVTFDAHKLFGASLTCSFLLTRHKNILREANDVSGADYLFHDQESNRDRGQSSWQCGRRADAISFWAIWKSMGTDGLGKVVDRFISIRNETLEWLKTQKQLQLVSEPDYLNICIRVQAPKGFSNLDWSRTVRESLKKKNLAFVNYSANQDGPFLRLILAHPFLQFSHVQQILQWAQDVR